MHMLSKKDLSSGELETLKKSRSTITVVTESLEDTLVVLSPGKLCKEHGYTCEWPSGPEPRLTKHGIHTLCRTGNFVPLVVPGLSSSSSTASSSTSPPQDLSSSDPANTRSNEGATGKCSEGVAGNCNGEGIPEWLEDFTEILEIAEVPAPRRYVS